MDRKVLINELQKNSDNLFDIIVIGGGATGLGIALDAVSRGFKTLLFEKSDFASGTSSRSTKLVHGGVRYLAQGDLLLVIEALRERGRLLKNAPYVTGNQEFVIPVYTYWDVILYTVGLKFYDLLAGRLSLGRSHYINREKTMARLPLLKSIGLKGGIVYHDGQFDDSRMTVSIAHSVVEKGGIILNYFPVTELLKDSNGKITGVKAVDTLCGSEYALRSKTVINATGVFADLIHRLDDPESRPTLRPSQGVHIVLDGSFLKSNSAIMIPATDDGRVLFAIPWHDRVVAGTTDTPLARVSQEPRALESEIDFILATAGKYLSRPPQREDVLSIFAGLRPLAANPRNMASTKDVSRRHKITLSKSGLLTIIGGKWTTYRCMAEEIIDRSVKVGFLEKRRCITRSMPVGNDPGKLKNERLRIYGWGATEIEKIIESKPAWGKPLSPDLPYTEAEIVWIARNEMPQRLEDILARRTRSLILNARASLEIAPVVAAIMAKEAGFDDRWQHKELDAYNKLTLNYI